VESNSWRVDSCSPPFLYAQSPAQNHLFLGKWFRPFREINLNKLPVLKSEAFFSGLVRNTKSRQSATQEDSLGEDLAGFPAERSPRATV
jgi:hypothetical protein